MGRGSEGRHGKRKGGGKKGKEKGKEGGGKEGGGKESGEGDSYMPAVKKHTKDNNIPTNTHNNHGRSHKTILKIFVRKEGSNKERGKGIDTSPRHRCGVSVRGIRRKVSFLGLILDLARHTTGTTASVQTITTDHGATALCSLKRKKEKSEAQQNCLLQQKTAQPTNLNFVCLSEMGVSTRGEETTGHTTTYATIITTTRGFDSACEGTGYGTRITATCHPAKESEFPSPFPTPSLSTSPSRELFPAIPPRQKKKKKTETNKIETR